MNKKIRVIARGSRLSRLQVEEVFKNFPELAYEIKYLESYGDKNQQISLLNGEAPADISRESLTMPSAKEMQTSPFIQRKTCLILCLRTWKSSPNFLLSTRPIHSLAETTRNWQNSLPGVS